MNDPKATQWLTKAGGLAKRLEQARGERSGLSLAKQLGWKASSKITRIENGTQIPTAADIKDWAAACDLSDAETQELLGLLDEFKAMHSVMRQRGRASAEPTHHDASGLAETSTLIRTYSTWAVPPILQLEPYAAAVLGAQDRLNPGATADPADRLAVRLRRQRLLFDPTRRFEFLLDEGVLYRRHGGAEVLRAQLQFLLTIRNLGIVPFAADVAAPAVESIAVYDDRAFAERLTGDEAMEAGELDLCTRLLEQLWSSAVEGEPARQLILEAIAVLDS